MAYTPEFIAKYTGFAAKETVTIRNIKNGKELRHIRILGPPRRRTQVELAYTDCLQLGVEAPARISGDNVQSGADCILIAEDDDGNLTNRSVELKSGIIRAWRHLHIYEDGHDMTMLVPAVPLSASASAAGGPGRTARRRSMAR